MTGNRTDKDNPSDVAVLVKAIKDERASIKRAQSVLLCLRLAVVNHGDECPSDDDIANGFRAVSEMLEGIRQRLTSGYVLSVIDRSPLTDAPEE